MSLSISNIAFDDSNYDEYIDYILSIGIKNIEVAPYKHFKTWKIEEINSDYFKKNNLNVVSTQGTFFNIDINLFNDPQQFIKHFKKVININELLGCNYTVFGSPSVRKVENDSISKRDYDFFNNIINSLSNDKVQIGIELNPKIYNCNFFYEIQQINNLHFNKNILFHFDTGCIYSTGACINKTFIDYKSLIKNIHISEPGLNNLLHPVIEHRRFANILTNNNFNGNISLEMKQQKLDDFKRSVDVFINIYKDLI